MHLTEYYLNKDTLYEHNDGFLLNARDLLNATKFLHTIDYKRNSMKLDRASNQSLLEDYSIIEIYRRV